MTGFAFCGSYCTLSRALEAAGVLAATGVKLLPIFSHAVSAVDSRFWNAKEFCGRAEEICGCRGIYTLPEAEPLGPLHPLDSLVICPCTGNTMARLAHGICDGPVTMAAKAHLRRDGKILLCPASNDALGAGMQNLASLAVRRNYYFCPLRQDDPINKPYARVSDFDRILEAYTAMREGKQLRPLFV